MDRARSSRGTPQEVGLALKDRGHSMFLAMPTSMGCGRRWRTTPNARSPSARAGLAHRISGAHPLSELQPEPVRPKREETVLSADGLWFKYEKDLRTW
jgi:energy-coupling factor transport system ATP-binding protein